MLKTIIQNLLIFIALCTFLFVSIRGIAGNPDSANLNHHYWKDEGPMELSPERGRFALMYSLIEDHSFQFSLPVAQFASPDVAIANGEFVSLFAPALSFLIVPGYLIGKWLNIAQVGAYGVIGLFAIFNVFLIKSIAQRLGAMKVPALVGGISFLFATPAFPYAVSLYQHHVSTFIILLSIYVLMRWNSILSLMFIWIACSFSVMLDNPNFFFMIPIGLLALTKTFSIRKIGQIVKVHIKPLALLSMTVAIIPMILFMYINLKSYGNPFQLAGTAANADLILAKMTDSDGDLASQIQIEEDRQAEQKGEEDKKTALGFFKTRQLLNGFYTHFLSLDRGMIMYTPIILIGILGLLQISDKNQKYQQLLIGIFGVVVLVYSLWGDPYGGWAFGSRYMIPAYAIMSIGLAICLTKFRKNLAFILLIIVLGGYSIFVNTIGAVTTNRIPPKVQVLALEEISGKQERYTYTRGMEMLDANRSKSFFFQTVGKNYMTAWQFAIGLTTIIGSLYSLLLIKIFASSFDWSKFRRRKR